MILESMCSDRAAKHTEVKWYRLKSYSSVGKHMQGVTGAKAPADGQGREGQHEKSILCATVMSSLMLPCHELTCASGEQAET